MVRGHGFPRPEETREPMARLRPQASLALFAAALPALAGAQGEAPPTPFGEDIEVVGKRQRPTAAADPTAAATVVDATRFAGEAKSVAELVATAPGVAVNGYGGLGQLATVSIRGSTADQVAVYLDGLLLNTGAGGGVDLSRIPREWIDRIEVIRGAEGAVFGAGTLGGAINIATRPVRAGTWSVEATGGSFGTVGASATAATGGQRWGALAAVAGDDTSGRFGYDFDPFPTLSGNALEPRARGHNAARSGGALAKLWAGVGPGRFDALLQMSGGGRDVPGSPYQPTPRDGQDDSRFALLTRLDEPVAPSADVAVMAAARTDALTVRVSPLPEARQRDLAAAVGARLTWRAGPSALLLRAEARGERLRLDGAPDRERASLSVGVSDALTLGRVVLSPAVGWDTNGRDRGASAKLGAALRLGGPFSIRASAGATYRPPSFAELYLRQGLIAPNPDLVPERGTSVDGAIVAEGALGFASAGAFATLTRDLIVYEQASFGLFKPFNDAKASTSGVEVEAATAPLGPLGIALSGAYTFLATETLRGGEDVLGKDLPHRARHRAYARAAIGRGPLEAHADVQYVGSQFLETRNLQPIAPVTAVGLGASARVWRRPDVRIHVEAKNLLDDRTLQDGFGNPLPGRMVLFTLRAEGQGVP
jgi:vitamin B12 transporter